MVLKNLFILFFIFLLTSFQAQADLTDKQPIVNSKSLHSQKNTKVLNEIEPYLMPDQHPIKERLDRLFSASRVVLNMKTLRAAGFKTSGIRKCTNIIVATHPDFPGYIFKLFIDAQRFENKLSVPEYWARRVQGARLIQKQIDQNGWQHLFKVPIKLVYILPSTHSSPREFLAKNYLLVEDNMDIYPDSINEAMWKSDHVSHELLSALFVLVKTLGLGDSVKPENIPFSKDGKVAHIDTQTFHVKVPYKKFNQFLSASNRSYWKKLYRNELKNWEFDKKAPRF